MQFEHFLFQGVFTYVTRGRCLTSASKFDIKPSGGVFDVSPENDCSSPSMKTPQVIFVREGSAFLSFIPRKTEGFTAELAGGTQ